MRFLITSAVLLTLFCVPVHAQEWRIEDPSQSTAATGRNDQSYFATTSAQPAQRVRNSFIGKNGTAPASKVQPRKTLLTSHPQAQLAEPPVATVAARLPRQDIQTTPCQVSGPGITYIGGTQPTQSCWDNRLAKTGEWRAPSSTFSIPYRSKIARAYGCNACGELDVNREFRDPRFFFGVDPETCCDEWDHFAGCGGLKANPGHWGRRWIRATDDVCMECRTCRIKKNKQESRAESSTCDCSRCNAGNNVSPQTGCSTCDVEAAFPSPRVARASGDSASNGILGNLFGVKKE